MILGVIVLAVASVTQPNRWGLYLIIVGVYLIETRIVSGPFQIGLGRRLRQLSSMRNRPDRA